MPHEVCCSEGKKGSEGQGKRKSQKVENSREEEEEIDKVPSVTLG